MKIKGVMFNKNTVINVEVNDNNFYVVRYGLISEKQKIINKLKEYKNGGLIGSINLPRNKYMQKELDELCRKKQILNRSIKQINKVFLN